MLLQFPDKLTFTLLNISLISPVAFVPGASHLKSSNVCCLCRVDNFYTLVHSNVLVHLWIKNLSCLYIKLELFIKIDLIILYFMSVSLFIV